MIEEPVVSASGKLQEAEFCGEPGNPFPRRAAEMHGRQRKCEQELDEKIAIARDVEAVGGRTGELEQSRG